MGSESAAEPKIPTAVPFRPENVVHGSEGTRFYMGEETPDYLPIDTGEEEGERRLTVINVTELLAKIDTGEANTIDVHGAPARGVPLLTNGHLGADLLYVAPGDSFPLHVHPGHHFLLCVAGQGTVTFDGREVPIRPNDLYMIEATIPHAVGAAADGEGHWLISFGAPHKRVESAERMELVEEGEAA